jgi:hypothetical protein
MIVDGTEAALAAAISLAQSCGFATMQLTHAFIADALCNALLIGK